MHEDDRKNILPSSNSGMEDEINQFNERNSVFDEKEREMRQKIAERFKLVEFQKDIDDIQDIMRNAEYREDAFKHRIILSESEHLVLMNAFDNINKHLAMCQTVLDAYVEFKNSTPKFANIFNLLYHFHKFMSAQRSRPYYEIKLERENKHYYVADKMREYVASIVFLLQRMMGALEVAGWYIIDSEVEAARNSSMGSGFYGGGGGFYGGGGGFYPTYPYGRNDNINYTRMNIVDKQRDIGDEGDK